MEEQDLKDENAKLKAMLEEKKLKDENNTLKQAINGTTLSDDELLRKKIESLEAKITTKKTFWQTINNWQYGLGFTVIVLIVAGMMGE